VSPDLLPDFPLRPFPDRNTGSQFSLEPGPDSFASAIAAADEGSILHVPPGVYSESFEVTKSLTFLAQGEVRLFGDGTKDTITVNAPFVHFDGFSIKHDANSARSAVAVLSGNLLLSNCEVQSNSIASIILKNDAGIKLYGCRVRASMGIPALTATGQSQVIADQSVFAETQTVAVTIKADAVGKFTRCRFRESAKGGLSSADRSRVFLDSCEFIECNIDLASSGGTNIVSGTSVTKDRGTGIVCAVSTTAALIADHITGCCVDSRDHSRVTLVGNEFLQASLFVWGSSTATSTGDRFRESENAAIAVSGSASLTLTNVDVKDIPGCGVLAYGESTVDITGGTVTQCRRSGVMAHSGAALTVADLAVSECDEAGILASETRAAQFTRVVLERNVRSGAELANVSAAVFSESRFLANQKVGLVLMKSTAAVDGGEFSGNGFSGIHAVESTVAVTGVQFTENKRGGVYAAAKSSVKLTKLPFARNLWSAVFVDAPTNGKADDCSFEANAIGVNSAGQFVVTRATFTGHTEAGVRSAGVVECVSCSWTEEPKVAIAAVAGSKLKAVEGVFENNFAHIEASGGGGVIVEKSTFKGSRGESGVHIGDGVGTFVECMFEQDQAVAIFSEGETNLDQSTVTGAGRIGLVFDGKASGKISQSTIERNGECGCQCINGSPWLVDNTIKEHTRFGLFVFRPGTPVVEGNLFEGNTVANVWRE
jgi:nitrous oxidase accessory protein NosD